MCAVGEACGMTHQGKAKRPDIWDKLLRLAGKAKGLPPDLAENHDHYIHGTPKKSSAEATMTLRGRIEKGVVVLDDPDALPDGTIVRIVPATQRKRMTPLAKKLLKWAGKAKGLPSDMARNHDHYLHGTAKR
jgi:hypothetical protein